jgi:hypothetical protein
MAVATPRNDRHGMMLVENIEHLHTISKEIGMLHLVHKDPHEYIRTSLDDRFDM